MEQIIAAISKYTRPSESLINELKLRLKLQTFKKREIIHSEFKICTNSFFIQKGILRLYYLKDGKEVSEFFCSENEWINSPKSFIRQEIDVYYIDAIENATVWTLHINDLMYLFTHFQEMETYARMDMGSTYLYLIERLAITRFSTAKEKYQHYLKTYAHIHPRIPLGMAASYIGIAQETLSRLRKETIF